MKIARFAILLVLLGLMGCGPLAGSTPTPAPQPPQPQPAEVTPTPAPPQNPPPVQTPAPPANPSGTTYTVRRGDNLFRIGLRYKLPWQQIAEANGVSDPRLLPVGKVLTIPGR